MNLVKNIKKVENIDMLSLYGPIEEKWNQNLGALSTEGAKELLTVIFRNVYTHYVETHRALMLHVLNRLINRKFREVSPPLTLKELVIGASASKTLPIKLAIHPSTSASYLYIPQILGFNIIKMGDMEADFDSQKFMTGEIEGLSLDPHIVKNLEESFNV